MQYGEQNEVILNYEEFCFAAENRRSVTGRTYYNEVHIGDLIVNQNHRRKRLGSRLIRAVENYFKRIFVNTFRLTASGGP